jgi:hypothetical protein
VSVFPSVGFGSRSKWLFGTFRISPPSFWSYSRIVGIWYS